MWKMSRTGCQSTIYDYSSGSMNGQAADFWVSSMFFYVFLFLCLCCAGLHNALDGGFGRSLLGQCLGSCCSAHCRVGWQQDKEDILFAIFSPVLQEYITVLWEIWAMAVCLALGGTHSWASSMSCVRGWQQRIGWCFCVSLPWIGHTFLLCILCTFNGNRMQNSPRICLIFWT